MGGKPLKLDSILNYGRRKNNLLKIVNFGKCLVNL